jgi:asparagine synthase (glutamine-hydrolysing)
MCGIFGIIDRKGLREGDRGMLAALAKGLVHRGPDGEGLHVGEHAAIGMRRLSIIDLEGGWQPLWNEDRSIALVANGEVYNFVELRAELEQRGHRFATGSDCETIVHLYEELGAECVHRLRGMFAFALIDFAKRKMIVVRDRIGEKPLYLAEQGDRIVFASELVALVAARAVPFEIDPAAVHEYFHWGLVPEPRSAVVGTRKLPAGCMLEISFDPWSVRERRWWDMAAVPEVPGDPGQAIKQVLDEVSRLIIRSDVPVGVALSGGADSAVIAALAARGYGGTVQGFTVGFDDHGRHDESAMAAETARYLGIPHHVVRLSPDDVVRTFPRVNLRRDDPLSDLSGPSYLAVMELARSHGVPVILSGQGGDELFWGYPFIRDAMRQSLRKREMLAGRVGMGSYVGFRRPYLSHEGLIEWLSSGFGLGIGWREWQRDRTTHPDRMIFWDERRAWWQAHALEPRLCTPGFMERTRAVDPAAIFTGAQLWERPDLAMTRLQIQTYLLSNGIDQCDRLSMAASVECRIPLVDYRLVEVTLGLRRRFPDDWKLPRKEWMLEATRGLVPDEIFRRRKRGFGAPWHRWGPAIFKAYGSQLLDGELRRAGILSESGARALTSPIDWLGRPRPLAMPTLMLEQWARGMRAAAGG